MHWNENIAWEKKEMYCKRYNAVTRMAAVLFTEGDHNKWDKDLDN